jgi:hypothetical protein
MVVIENKQYKKINEQYTKQYLMTSQTVPKDVLIATNTWAQESPKSELRLKSYDRLKLIDYLCN